jgi:hypothetical protein
MEKITAQIIALTRQISTAKNPHALKNKIRNLKKQQQAQQTKNNLNNFLAR